MRNHNGVEEMVQFVDYRSWDAIWGSVLAVSGLLLAALRYSIPDQDHLLDDSGIFDLAKQKIHQP